MRSTCHSVLSAIRFQYTVQGGKRCNPEEICVKRSGECGYTLGLCGVFVKDPDFEQHDGNCKVDEDCKSDEK